MDTQASLTATHNDGFTKEQIKRRLRAHAVSLWSLQETDADNLDPVIDLLIGACAVEFERTAHQVNASQARVLERLAELMVPEVTTSARPAHAILHACAEAPTTIIKKNHLFSADKDLLQGNKTITVPINLSPATDFPLFDATIVCQASRNRVTFYETPFTKGDSIYATNNEGSYNSTLWLGIKLNNKIKSLKGLSFYFDWKSNSDKANYIPLISATSWSEPGKEPIKVQNGINQVSKSLNKKVADQDKMKPFEDHVLQIYQNHFITIREEYKPSSLTNYPPPFKEIYSEDSLKNFKDDLIWLEIQFPEGLPLQAIDEVYCSLNCFPVMNRKLHAGNRPYSLSSSLNIIPLAVEEHFISVNRVFTGTRDYHSVSLDEHRDMEDGTYSVKQSGMRRFDNRDAEALLHYLYELMRDESAVFKAFGNYALNTEIKGLEQSLSRLKLHFLNKPVHQSSKCHLLLNTKIGEDVWIEFWTSQGALANGLTAGTKVKPLSQGNVKRTMLMLLTPVSGGREPLNEAEKVHAFKFALLTRSRIATEEDLKAACFAELGDKIRNVEIKKGFKNDLSSRTGFIKTIDLMLTPAPGFQDLDWNAICNELKTFIDKNKIFLTQIQIFTTNKQAYATT